MENRILELWSVVGHSAALTEVLPKVLLLLQRWYPLRRILVRQIEHAPPVVLTIAMASSLEQASVAESIAENRLELTESELRSVAAWHALRQPIVTQGGLDPSYRITRVLPPELAGTWLAVSLGDPEYCEGLILLELDLDLPLEQKELEFFRAASDPLSSAFKHDRQQAELKRLARKADEERRTALRRAGRTGHPDRVVGENGGLRTVMERVALVTDSDVPVLILGETGTGKEVVSKAIHTRSARRDGPFIRVNCGAIPPELIDAQLFGHEKGSFTGADQARAGWFERADGGTLFLDEIGELPLEAQVRFLRVLQDGFIERVGGRQPIHIDVRIIAATHRDLAAMVRTRTFREDLWYRLAVFPIQIPPLRDRQRDIPELAWYFAERAAVRFSLSPCHPTTSDIELLQQYPWPGNIRELGAVIDRAAILGEGKTLEIRTALGVFDSSWQSSSRPTAEVSTKAPSAGLATDKAPQDWSLDNAMRRHIESVLQFTQGRIEGTKGAAALLKINPHTLRARMRKLKITWSEFRGGHSDSSS